MFPDTSLYERLTLQHEFLPFDCGDEDLNEYLYQNAKEYQRQLLAVTYYLQNGEDTILFFSLLNDKIDREITEVIKTAVGGAAGVIKAVESATTDCQPNDNVEALRVYMLAKKVECLPVWKPMHKQPVYTGVVSEERRVKSEELSEGIIRQTSDRSVAYINGVSEEIFKVGFCLPAGPYVTDEDVRYIVECIREAIV